MNIRETGIDGLLILEPKVFKDSRGYFFESYHKSRMEELGIYYKFIQDNQSQSTFGVIRGLHFQQEPHTQTKLLRVLEGQIYDVAVDIRSGSPTYGQWFGIDINSENQLQLIIPGGFAHGFSVLSPHATVFYKCDAYYHPESESGIRFDDPELQIDWKIEMRSAVVSDKDRDLPYFKDL
ncbi:MAG: dTDP-4-dehydrorhamnose 3,5-epimerase [Bacteroidales bacterium]|nr:dTDP-4-dehydrorhamnose 3,5-epimerase [Bacteroidales bacterium]